MPETGVTRSQTRSACLALTVVLGLTMAPAIVGAQRLTPGGLAWRVHSEPAGAANLLAAGLRDQDPAVRTVAARLLAVAREHSLTADVEAALGRETDPTAEAEEVRALLSTASERSLAAVETRVATMSPEAASVYVSWMARGFPVRFRNELPQLVDRFTVGRKWDLSLPVAIAVRMHPAERAAILATWMQLAPVDQWHAVLATLAATPADAADPSAIRAALP